MKIKFNALKKVKVSSGQLWFFSVGTLALVFLAVLAFDGYVFWTKARISPDLAGDKKVILSEKKLEEARKIFGEREALLKEESKLRNPFGTFPNP